MPVRPSRGPGPGPQQRRCPSGRPNAASGRPTSAARVDIRVVAPDGSARYRQALAADLRSRRAVGQQLLRDPSLAAAPSARAALAAGQVDARLLVTLAALAASDPAGQPLRVTGFGAADPGVGPGLPVRTARLAASGGTARRMLAFLRAQRSPYQPGYAGTAGSVVTVEFAAPAPLGLLGNQ
jgi:hypothetical protein